MREKLFIRIFYRSRFHRQVELSFLKTGKVYDFLDFEKVIRKPDRVPT